MRSPIPAKWKAAAAAALSIATLSAAPFAHAASRETNDPYFPQQWYLQHIGVSEAWNTSLGFEGVIVAVIDSGVDIDHPDLKDNIWRNEDEIAGDGIDNDGNGYVDDVYGWDFVEDDADPDPSTAGGFSTLGANHGTISAGIIAARGDNGKGIVGVTWQTRIMAIRALASNGEGDPTDIVRAVEYAVANGASIINLSFAGDTRNDLMRIALRRAYDAGVLVVAAAGNAPEGGDATDLDRDPRYPVCLDQGDSENFIYGVAATDAEDRKAGFSNYGAGCVDISAPGTRIISTQRLAPEEKDFTEPYGGYYNGTSVAAPIVAGAAALLKAMDRNLTPKQIQNIFTATAFNIDGINSGYFGKLGRGRIEVAKAVRYVQDSAQRRPAAPAATRTILPEGASRIVIASAGAGRAPEVRMFTEDGLFVRSFSAYPDSFTGGVNTAIANFDGVARHTIVTGAGPGGAPQVRVFNINTEAIGGFYAYDQGFMGGVDVAVGDLDGDGKDEIVTGAGPGGGPHVRVFTPKGVPIGGFFAFDERSRDGVTVAVADLDGDGRSEIVATRGDGKGEVRVFSGKGELIGSVAPEVSGRIVSLANAGKGADGRETVVVNDTVHAAAVVSTDAESGAPTVREGAPDAVAFLGAAAGAEPIVTVRRSDGSELSFLAFEPRFRGGAEIGIMEVRQ